MEEFCKNFTYGNPHRSEFYSPGYPVNYPPGIKCFRTISADYGYFVRLDFRDFFNVEPPSKDEPCEYDYLEIRDGDKGYSPLLGKFCGSKFPPIITSSGRSLWLRFVSDGTIEYNGFKAVYSFILNPLETLPFIPKCQFEVGGAMDFIGNSNISDEHLHFAENYSMPIDCTWVIRVEKEKKIFLQFVEYKLEQPNDCNFNYIQLFDDNTDMDNIKKTFCGSRAEYHTSGADVLYVRYYAVGDGIGSEFVAFFTAVREIGDGEQCEKTEYDCADSNCIDTNLLCNGMRNCAFGWDEESCAAGGSNIPLDFSATHVILIIICLALLLVGMCAGMIFNLVRKLTEDKEDIQASREKSLASLAASRGSLGPDYEGTTERAVTDVGSVEDCNGCYVPGPPGGGFPFNSRD